MVGARAGHHAPATREGEGGGMTHEVMVLCSCDNIECCKMERYVSDVRIAIAQIERLARLVIKYDATDPIPDA
jgi:hypothetical protein